MREKVDVPSRYRYGSGDGVDHSPYQRYLSAYENAFWACARKRAGDIGYRYTAADLAGNGWPAAVDGHRDGCLAAGKRVDRLVEDYGREAVQKHLREITGEKP